MQFKNKNLILDNYNPYSYDLLLTHDYDGLDFNNGSLSDYGLITHDLFYYYDFDYSHSQDESTAFSSKYDFLDCNNETFNIKIKSSGETIGYQFDNNIEKYVMNFDGGFLYSDNQEVPIFSNGFTLNYWIKTSGNTEGYLLKLGDNLNGYGFYIKGNKLGFKSVVERIDGDETLIPVNYNIETPEFYIGENKWFNVSIIFKRNQEKKICCNDSESIFSDEFNYVFGEEDTPIDKFPICTELKDIPDTHKGKLTFLINGRPIHSLVVEEPVIEEFLLLIGKDFLGDISIASLYKRALSIPEIIRNFYGLKSIYKRTETFGGANIIVSPNLIK